MSIETWGLMPKNQIDAETIEEAIERLIAVHEHSPDSHMGENEAIEAHRKSEIIDHLASSIVADKFSQVSNLFYNTWQSITDWFTNGTILNGFLVLQLMQRGDFSGDRYLWNETIEFLTNQDNDTVLDNIWQTEFTYYQNYHTADYSFGMGIGEGFDPLLVCACFKIINGVLYSVFGNDETYTIVNLGSLVNSKRYNVRVETVANTQTLNFYLNGEIVATYDVSSIPSFYMNSFGIYSKKVGGTVSSQTSYIKFRYLAIGNSTF